MQVAFEPHLRDAGLPSQLARELIQCVRLNQVADAQVPKDLDP